VDSLEDLRDADHYARTPESLIFDRQAPHTAVRLYGALDRFLNKRTRTCFPGYRKITQRTGMGSATLSRAFKYLEANRFIRILRTREGTRVRCSYQLMEVKGKAPLPK